MRFLKPKPGTTYIAEWFAWLPVRIGDETRWLETVCVEQVYGEKTRITEPGIPVAVSCWINKRFLDLPTPGT